MTDNHTADEIIEMMKDNWPEIYSPEADSMIYMNRVQQFSHARVCEVLADFNLTLGEFDILATLRRSAKPHVLLPSQLQRSVLITSGGLTKMLYHLESIGLISRSVREKDKRCKRVHLTPKGKRVTEKAMAAAHDARDKWLDETYTKRELRELTDLLRKAARSLENHEPA